ncbi:MAG: hypothetical protein ACJASL_004720 [Paraglaciecola sp.]|jgi:hypothetical protein|tara:strand:- start:462 stop:611 length:150 start_codon:yes stop_codon:yes gene_type:complete
MILCLYIIADSRSFVSPAQEQTLDLLLSTGWSEWQAKGMLELPEVFATN